MRGLIVALLASLFGPASAPPETPMLKTLAGMNAAMSMPSSGDVDRDFAMMMAAHHQGAVDMARQFLVEGHNERLRRLAQEIIVTQDQEIAVMRDILVQIDPTICRSP